MRAFCGCALFVLTLACSGKERPFAEGTAPTAGAAGSNGMETSSQEVPAPAPSVEGLEPVPGGGESTVPPVVSNGVDSPGAVLGATGADRPICGSDAGGCSAADAGPPAPPPCVPTGPRQCDSDRDNDCDGQPDNVVDDVCQCVPGAVEACDEHVGLDGRGPCRAGTRTCVAADGNASTAFGPCEGAVGPLPEDSCTPEDDGDCDGVANEGCDCIEGATQPCGPPTDLGVCQRGIQTCVGGAFGECVGATFPAPRDCRFNVDNDCNGQPDNAIDNVCQCVIGTSQACGQHPQDGVGSCRAGQQICQAGPGNSSSAPGQCTGSVGPAPADLCDGTDTNCNGQANDNCGSPEGSPCSTTADCRNSECVTFYGDGDEDGFAAVESIDTALRVCATATFLPEQTTRVRPASLATTDCLDTNETVHPGQQGFFTAPVVGLTPSYDYDCDGIEVDPTDNKVSDCNDQTIAVCEDRGGWDDPGVPPCGQTGGFQPCGQAEGSTLCSLFPGGPSSPRQCH